LGKFAKGLAAALGAAQTGKVGTPLPEELNALKTQIKSTDRGPGLLEITHTKKDLKLTIFLIVWVSMIGGIQLFAIRGLMIGGLNKLYKELAKFNPLFTFILRKIHILKRT
jgi:hypothetical protein